MVQWSPSSRLDVAEIDSWLESALISRETEITLGSLRRVSARAESLLQSAIIRLQRAGVAVSFSVPELTFSAGRTARATEESSDEPMTPTEGLLGDSVAGLTIALLCRPADDHAARARAHVLDRLREHRGQWGRGFQSSRIETQSVDGIRSSTWPSSRVASRDATSKQLIEMAKSVIGRSAVENMGDRLSRWAVDFSFEAMQNARTHGRVGYRREALTSLRSLTLRRHNLEGRPLSDVLGRSEGPFRDYADRVAHRNPKRILELVVADGGIGIPGRMQKDPNIYTSFEDSEAQLVQEAMWPGWTTDPVRSLESGEGFRMILRASARLNGYFEIRTGRQEFSRHYLNKDGGPAGADFGDGSPTNPAYELERHPSRPYVAGSILTLLFPIETD
jgi:hypothetical protein